MPLFPPCSSSIFLSAVKSCHFSFAAYFLQHVQSTPPRSTPASRAPGLAAADGCIPRAPNPAPFFAFGASSGSSSSVRYFPRVCLPRWHNITSTVDYLPLCTSTGYRDIAGSCLFFHIHARSNPPVLDITFFTFLMLAVHPCHIYRRSAPSDSVLSSCNSSLYDRLFFSRIMFSSLLL